MGYQLFEFENLEDCHKALIDRFKEFFNNARKFKSDDKRNAPKY